MKRLRGEDLEKAIKSHEDWACGSEDGAPLMLFDNDLSKANLAKKKLPYSSLVSCDLSYADLSGAMMGSARMTNADFSHASLCKADLTWADLCGASFFNADLTRADLTGANLSGADLTGANLTGARLEKAVLARANLYAADLRGADMYMTVIQKANLQHAKNIPPRISASISIVPEEGAFVGWKACRKGRIVKILIPEDAKRSSSTGRKCRCSKALVLEITDYLSGEKYDDAESAFFHPSVTYRVGDIIEASDFSENRWKECAPGIHFFITKEEAVSMFDF